MDDTIMDILDGAINKNTEVNESALEKLIYTTCDKKNLDEYVNGICFIDKSQSYYSPMAYSMVKKMIIVDLYKMNEFLKSINSSVEHTIKKNHQDMYVKIFLEHMILHEMDHALQNKISREKNADIEAKLVKLELHPIHTLYKPFLLMLSNSYRPLKEEMIRNTMMLKSLKEKYDSISPTEKLAEYHSLKEVINYLSSGDINYSDITSVLKMYLAYFLLDGYDFNSDISSPTKRYINDFKQAKFIRGNRHFTKEFYHLLEDTKRDTLERRLSLGLDITKDEYKKVKKMIS